MKNSYKVLTAIIICLMATNEIFSQNASADWMPFDPVVIPRTPERGQFPTLMDNFSVNHFTGQPNIEIPVYTVDERDIQVPIGLKYRTGGLRVDVENSYLGLHWDLIVGGEIRRTLVGMPDEMDNDVKGYHYIHKTISGYQHQDRQNFINTLKDNEDIFPLGGYSDNTASHCKILKLSLNYGQQYSDGRFDTGPDIYNFNVAGLSGTFTTGTGGSVENLQTNEWISIVHHINFPYNYFEITDSKGYVYTFDAKETHEYKYRSGYFVGYTAWQALLMRKFNYVLSWKLSKIQSPTGETVSFHYNTHNKADKWMERSIYKTLSSFTNTYDPQICGNSSYKLNSESQKPVFSDNPNENKEEYTYQYLTKITSTNTRVDFNYFVGFDSIPQLNAIKIYAGSDTVNVLKKFEINDAGSYSYEKIYNIKEYGSGNTFREYKFSYYPSPSFIRFSSGQKDHWGYYSPSAKEFASGIYNFQIDPYNPGIKFIENPASFGHRNPRLYGANDGMLRRIDYPTGGKVSFDWEFHDYSKRSALLHDVSVLHSGSMTDGYFERGQVTFQPTYHEVKTEINHTKTSTEIDVTGSTSVKIDLNEYYPKASMYFMGHINDCYENGQLVNGTTYCKCIENWETNGGSLVNIPYVRITGLDNSYSKTMYITKDTVWKEYSIPLSAGRYRFQLFNVGKELIQDPTYCPDFYTNVMTSASYGKVGISLSYFSGSEEYINRRDSTFLTGGTRIKEMIFEGGDNKIRKLYNYSLNPYKKKSPSSGVLTKAPRYGSKSCSAKPDHSCPLDDYSMMDIPLAIRRYTLSANALPKTPEPSGHIEYSHVTEFITSGSKSVVNNKLDSLGNTQVTMYEFWTSENNINHRSDINETLNLEYLPNNQLILTSKHFKRGHLKQKTEFTNEEKTTKYEYGIWEKDNAPLIPGTLFIPYDYSTSNWTTSLSSDCNGSSTSLYEWYKDFGIVRYRIIPYNKRIVEIKETGTLTNKLRWFRYGFPFYSGDKLANSPVSESTIDSKGDTIVNYYTYTSSNKVNAHVTVCGGKITSAYRYVYDGKDNLTSVYMAEIEPSNSPSAANHGLGSLNMSNSIFTLTNKHLETREYETRQGKNRLCRVINHNTNVSTVYIWGYRGEYPIAEIKNCTLAQRDAKLTGSQLNTLMDSENPDMTVINNLRNQLAGSFVTTFTYKMKVGVTSVTDPRGITTYYDYNDFGELQECYIIENSQKKIVQKMEYHWNINM